jgi:hypothetical protein
MGKKRKHEQLQTPLDITPLPVTPTDDTTIKQSRTTPLSTYRTIKIPIKSILRNKKNMLPLIKELVIRANDLMIHTYQFIRLYILNQYTHQSTIQVINEKFIQYCMKTLGTRDKRGRKCEDPLIHELQKLEFMNFHYYSKVLYVIYYSYELKLIFVFAYRSTNFLSLNIDYIKCEAL